jgi:hypothetical protein
VPLAVDLALIVRAHSTNFDKYHPGYFGKVGMRYFHKTPNQFWKPIINIDKLWSLVPKEEREGITEDSEVVPVIDTLHHGYGKVLGNGQYVLHVFALGSRTDVLLQAPEASLYREGAVRLQDCRVRALT